MFRSWHDRQESWAATRRRIIRETEVFLEEGLRHPERHLVIPAVPVGKARFPTGMASLFWTQILGSS